MGGSGAYEIKDGRLTPLSQEDLEAGARRETLFRGADPRLEKRSPGAFKKIAHEQRRQIITALCQEFPTLDREVIKRLYNREIERLSENATILTYIPSLAWRGVKPTLHALSLRKRSKMV